MNLNFVEGDVKERFYKSLEISFVLTLIFMAAIFFEELDGLNGALHGYQLAIMSFVSLLLFSILFFTWFSLVKLHSEMTHIGWKRLLVILYFVGLPFLLYYFHEFLNVRKLADYVVWGVLVSSFYYLLLIGAYWTVSKMFRWVESGFKNS